MAPDGTYLFDEDAVTGAVVGLFEPNRFQFAGFDGQRDFLLKANDPPVPYWQFPALTKRGDKLPRYPDTFKYYTESKAGAGSRRQDTFATDKPGSSRGKADDNWCGKHWCGGVNSCHPPVNTCQAPAYGDEASDTLTESA